MHTDNIWLENATESAWEVVESDHLRNPNSHCGEGGGELSGWIGTVLKKLSAKALVNRKGPPHPQYSKTDGHRGKKEQLVS